MPAIGVGTGFGHQLSPSAAVALQERVKTRRPRRFDHAKGHGMATPQLILLTFYDGLPIEMPSELQIPATVMADRRTLVCIVRFGFAVPQRGGR
jgi:hypothetical protein